MEKMLIVLLITSLLVLWWCSDGKEVCAENEIYTDIHYRYAEGSLCLTKPAYLIVVNNRCLEMVGDFNKCVKELLDATDGF